MDVIEVVVAGATVVLDVVKNVVLDVVKVVVAAVRLDIVKVVVAVVFVPRSVRKAKYDGTLK